MNWVSFGWGVLVTYSASAIVIIVWAMLISHRHKDKSPFRD